MKAAKRSSVAARSRVASGGAPPAPHARTGSKRRAAAARRGTRMARHGGMHARPRNDAATMVARPPSLGRLSPRRPPSTPPRPSRNERRSCAAAAPACRSSPARCRAGRRRAASSAAAKRRSTPPVARWRSKRGSPGLN
ncbi:hypothetical protein BOC49_35150 [Burkholderia pseudomallei]|nr:hypothetical protein BOC49_35150 [Burkholderia pseudomallei]